MFEIKILVRKTDTGLSALEAFLEIVMNLLALLGAEVVASGVVEIPAEAEVENA